MNNTLTPQDIYHLCIKWHDDNGQNNESLSNTIANWLKQGFRLYQNENKKINAFFPISYRIGTSIDSISYINDLAEIINYLNYNEYPFSSIEKIDFYDCAIIGIEKSILLQLNDFHTVENITDENYEALLDSLILLRLTANKNKIGSSCYKIFVKYNNLLKKINDANLQNYIPNYIDMLLMQACYINCHIGCTNDTRSFFIKLLKITKTRNNISDDIINNIKYCHGLVLPYMKVIKSSDFIDEYISFNVRDENYYISSISNMKNNTPNSIAA